MTLSENIKRIIVGMVTRPTDECIEHGSHSTIRVVDPICGDGSLVNLLSDEITYGILVYTYVTSRSDPFYSHTPVLQMEGSFFDNHDNMYNVVISDFSQLQSPVSYIMKSIETLKSGGEMIVAVKSDFQVYAPTIARMKLLGDFTNFVFDEDKCVFRFVKKY